MHFLFKLLPVVSLLLMYPTPRLFVTAQRLEVSRIKLSSRFRQLQTKPVMGRLKRIHASTSACRETDHGWEMPHYWSLKYAE